MVAKEGTTVEQEQENHYGTAKAEIRQVTKEPPITHECLCQDYSTRGEKVNHKLESLPL